MKAVQQRNDYITLYPGQTGTGATHKNEVDGDVETWKDGHGKNADRFHQLSPLKSLTSGGSLEKSITLTSQMLYFAPGVVQAEAKAFSPSEQTTTTKNASLWFQPHEKL